MVVIYCYLERENYIIGIIPLTVKEAPPSVKCRTL